jgi:hypothetical protein
MQMICEVPSVVALADDFKVRYVLATLEPKRKPKFDPMYSR